MSSDKQEASPHQQRSEIETFAAENGYRIVNWYVDESISGSRSDREAFQRLIAGSKNGTFRAVLCWDQDRFSRFPPLEANHYWYILDTAGVHIATVAQGRLKFDSLGSWLEASVIQYGKAEYLKDLARNIKRGQREAASRGEWMGTAPRGYVSQNKRLILGDPKDVPLIRRIFDLFIDGPSPWIIAERLDDDGAPTTKGGRWSKSTIDRILRNEAYVATYRRGEIAIPANHPAIVNPEMFSAAQDRLSDCQCPSRSPKHKQGYLLTGLVHCGDCGARMQGKHHCGRHIYVCSGYWRNRGVCSRNTVLRKRCLVTSSAPSSKSCSIPETSTGYGRNFTGRLRRSAGKAMPIDSARKSMPWNQSSEKPSSDWSKSTRICSRWSNSIYGNFNLSRTGYKPT